MAFISSAKNNSGKEEVNTASFPTASTQVSPTSANVVAASFSHDTVCAYIASQSNGSQIKYEDINQIDEDNIEEMDIKWNMALLSMRADRFWKKTGKKITIQGNDVAGFDKSKVECFNCHKMGHFARECRAPRSQDRGRRENFKHGSKTEEQAPEALMAIDGVGWDWSYMTNEEEDHALLADQEALIEFTLMAKSSSNNEVFDNSLCSKACKKNTGSLNTKITELSEKLSNAKTTLYHYKLDLSQVEARLVEFKNQEIKVCEKIKGLEYNVKCKNDRIERLTNEIEELKKEKEGLNNKLIGFQSASKDLDTLTGSQRSDKTKEGLRYSAVPPLAQVYSPPKRDMSWTGLPEFADDTITDYSRTSPSIETDSPTVIKTNKDKTVRKSSVKYAEMYRKLQRVLMLGGNSQNVIDDKGYWDNGCSRHMTGNISYLSDYEPYDGGYVSFRQGGGKITCKGIIKTECITLGRDFKLKDDTNVLLRTPRQHNMYSINLNNNVPHKDLTCLVAKASADESILWHRRLGHLNFKTMNKLVRHNLVRGLHSKYFENDHTCVACLKGKQQKASCKTKLVNSVSKPLHTLHMDLFYPTSVSSLNHKWYCLVVTDDFSRFTWTFFLKTKDESSGILRNFITELENLKELKNRVAERRNRTLIEAARTMLADAKLPITFWAEAVNTACYVQNRVLVNKSQNKTPYKLFNGRTHAIGFLKPFGCHVMILNTLDNLRKFDAKGDEGYLIGYSMSSKAFRVFNKRTKKVEENLHVDFLANKLIEKGAGPNWLFDINTLTNSMNYVPVVVAGTSSTNFSAHLESSTSNAQDACNADPPESNENFNPTATSTNPPADQMETLTVETLIPTEEPKKISDALKDPSWVEAMQEELLQFKIQNVWILVDCHKGEEGIDYEEVFAPVSRIEAIRLFLAYASFMGFTVYQMDVKSAFLYARVYKVEKEMYGLHQAPRAWYGTLSKYLLTNGFQRGTIDQTLFIRKHKGDFLLVQVYVDNIIFGSSNPQLCREFEAPVHEKFQMSAMGELNFFLGLQVLQKKDGIFLSQDKYVGDILKKFRYSYVRSANTLMDKGNPWGKDGTGKDIDLHLYRSMIGSLMYLTASRPDIMFAVCACSRHQVTPKECHLHAVKRIFRYLKGHPKLGLCYPKDSLFDLVAYSDSDYGGDTQDKKSTTAASGYGQVLWIQNQLLDYGIETTDEGTKIIPTVDGKLRTIFKSSIRRNLKLNDEEGIKRSILPSVEVSNPYHYAMFKSEKYRQYSKKARIAQSSALPTAADEPASPSGDTSALPHDSTPRVTSLTADEGSMQQQLNELTNLCTRLQRQQTEMATKIAAQDLEISNLKARIKLLEAKDRGGAEPSREDATIKGRSLETRKEAGVERSTKIGSNDTKELVNVLTSLDATNILTSGVSLEKSNKNVIGLIKLTS
nr:hypothetical protein [Tanacetum cinerariifolium]